MKKIIVLLLVLCVCFTSCSAKKEAKGLSGDVIVSAAASLTDVMKEIIAKYNEKNPNVSIKASYAGSGALQTQIEEGAPVDIFISAANKQMNALDEKGLVDKDNKKGLLVNEVVLITPKDGKSSIKDFSDIANDTVSKIAIADPSSVPVGQYSEEIFTNLGNWDVVKAKMVMSQDVRQTLDWVVNKEVDAGVVYKTDAYSEIEKINIVCSAPEGTHKKVEYPAAIIKDNAKKEQVKSFYDFLSTDEAKALFEKHGFVVQ